MRRHGVISLGLLFLSASGAGCQREGGLDVDGSWRIDAAKDGGVTPDTGSGGRIGSGGSGSGGSGSGGSGSGGAAGAGGTGSGGAAGAGGAGSGGACVTAVAGFHALDFRITDAEFSAPLNRIVAVSSTPENALYLIDPESGQSQKLKLPLTPLAVSVSPDGQRGAVGHDAYVSDVDLSTLTLTHTYATTCDVADVVLGGNGWAYVFPMTDQWVGIHSIDLTTGAESPVNSWMIYAGTKAKLHPAGKAIYGADNGLSPSDIERYSITAGAAVLDYDSPYHGDYPMCGNLWISSDGARIFTRCGRVFRASEVKTEDMTYNGRVESVDLIRSLWHASTSGKVLVLPEANQYAYPPSTLDDTKLRVHGYEFLVYEKTIDLPLFPGTCAGAVSHGRFVFANAAGNRYYVLIQADASSGYLNDNAVVALDP